MLPWLHIVETGNMLVLELLILERRQEVRQADPLAALACPFHIRQGVHWKFSRH